MRTLQQFDGKERNERSGIISVIITKGITILTEVSDLNGRTVIGRNGVDGEMSIDKSHLVHESLEYTNQHACQMM